MLNHGKHLLATIDLVYDIFHCLALILFQSVNHQLNIPLHLTSVFIVLGASQVRMHVTNEIESQLATIRLTLMSAEDIEADRLTILPSINVKTLICLEPVKDVQRILGFQG